MKAEPYALSEASLINFDILQERKANLKKEEVKAVETLVRVRARRAEMDHWLAELKKENKEAASKELLEARRKALTNDERMAEEILVSMRARLEENYHWINFVQGVDHINSIPLGSAVLVMGGGNTKAKVVRQPNDADGRQEITTLVAVPGV